MPSIPSLQTIPSLRRDDSLTPNTAPGDELAQISQQLDDVSHAKQTHGNTIVPFIDGENALPELLRTLQSAKTSITYETFEFHNDTSANQVADALIAAKRRGVEVKVVADAVGSRELLWMHNPALKKMRDAGVSVEVYDPIRSFAQLDFHRDHRKTVVVDGKEAWVGGMNTGDAYLGPPSTPSRYHDVFAELQGPAVQPMISDFADSWAYAKDPISGLSTKAETRMVAPQGTNVRIVEHTPLKDTNIRDTYLTLINNAKKTIYVENKYPLTFEMETALAAAALRGVDVNYIVGPGSLLAEARFPELLTCGVHIYQYADGVHTKALSVDGLVSTVGSSNVDNVSLSRNREIIAVMEDPAFTQKLDEDLFKRDMVADHQGHPTTPITQTGKGLLHRAEVFLVNLLPASDQ